MEAQREFSADVGGRLLNLGCGDVFHPDWVNIDFHDHGGAVIAYDLRLGIPFAENTFDVVYHSRVLEHFTRENGVTFLEECFRVLRPGGVLRVVVSDLEDIARAYLAALGEVRDGKEGAGHRHEWMTVELLDQMVRHESGGEMAAFWRRTPVPEEAFVLSRAGQCYARFRETFAGKGADGETGNVRGPLPSGNAGFWQSGELHRWMYDAVSLSRLLETIGFTAIVRQNHNTSSYREILDYGLDSASDGTVRRPGSLFLEAVKPQIQALGEARIKAALFSTSDAGGAGIAALRLHKSLLAQSITPHMYVADQRTCTPSLHVLPSFGQKIVQLPSGGAALSGLAAARQARAAKLSQFLDRPPGLEYYTFTEHCADLNFLPFYKDFDLFHFHWIANFLDPGLSFDALRDRPVVWTLHDMRPFTGGCHYANGCRKFMEHCGACPQLGSHDPQDDSFRTWRHSMTAYRKLDLHIVAPSEWLAKEARQSSLFKRFPVHVIPYAQPLDVFRPLNKGAVRQSMGLDQAELVLAFSAQNLANQRKGAHFLVESMKVIAQGPLREKIRLLLLGNNPADIFFHLGLNVNAVGHIGSPEQMAVVYNAVDAVLVPSLEDNSPNVICEAAGCGVPVIAFAAGGIPEMIRHGETGWLASVGSVEGLVLGVEWINAQRRDPKLSLRCRALALERWNPSERARDYELLYKRLCTGSQVMHDESK